MLLFVARESAAVFGFDSPKASLMVHLQPRVFSGSSNQIWVSAHFWGFSASAPSLNVSLCFSVSPSFS
jgi:hypothetical protein